MQSKRICFLVGSAALSGGSYVIFQHASYLVDNGYDVTLAVQEAFDESTVAWHDHSHKFNFVEFEDGKKQRFDLVIATWWKTALELASFEAHRYAYFVQSIESRFYPESEGPLRALVDATYGLPCAYVTEATWISNYLQDSHGRQAALVRNGIRKDLYTSGGPVIVDRPRTIPRILIEGHFGVSFKNTALALKLAKAAGAQDIWVMTGSPVKSLPGVSRVFSRVPIDKTPEIYRSCDILVKLSTVEGMFGPPLEMFHCGGTAVVFDVTGFDEYIKDGRNAYVIRGRDTSCVIEKLKELLSSPGELMRLKKGALETADMWPDWSQSSREFAVWVESVFAQPIVDREEIGRQVQSAWRKYSAEEGLRLKKNRLIVWKYRLKATAQKMPPKIRNKIKYMQTIMEIISPSRRVF